jgi:hypothetical protein
MLITVKYLPCTNSRGARFVVSNGRDKKTFPYDYEAHYARESALSAFCRYFSIKKHWLDGGYIKDTRIYISSDSPKAFG